MIADLFIVNHNDGLVLFGTCRSLALYTMVNCTIYNPEHRLVNGELQCYEVCKRPILGIEREILSYAYIET